MIVHKRQEREKNWVKAKYEKREKGTELNTASLSLFQLLLYPY